MKRIIFSSVLLLFTALVFGQTITLNNAAALGTKFYQGQSITLELTATNITDQFIAIGASGSDLEPSDITSVTSDPILDPVIMVGTFGTGNEATEAFIDFGPNFPFTGDITVTLTIPSNFDFDGGSSVDTTLLLRSQNDFSGTNNIEGITIFESQAALSIKEISPNKLSDYSYDTDSNIITLTTPANYSVYNLAGNVVAEGLSSAISLAGLVDGVYIVATANSTTKVVKY